MRVEVRVASPEPAVGVFTVAASADEPYALLVLS
jgi:hypothetical protein